jgi:hypothetical protein
VGIERAVASTALSSFQRTPKKPTNCKIRYRKRAGVLEKLCGGTFKNWLQAFLDELRTSPKVTCSVAPNFQKIRNCKVLKVPLPGFDNPLSG